MITDTERYIRIKHIQDLIGKGWSNKSIRKFLEDVYDLKTAQSQNKWIKEALNDLYKEDNPRKAVIKEINDDKLDDLYQKALELPDSVAGINTALKIIDTQNKLNGLYTEKKIVQVASDNEIIINFGE